MLHLPPAQPGVGQSTALNASSSPCTAWSGPEYSLASVIFPLHSLEWVRVQHCQLPIPSEILPSGLIQLHIFPTHFDHNVMGDMTRASEFCM